MLSGSLPVKKKGDPIKIPHATICMMLPSPFKGVWDIVDVVIFYVCMSGTKIRFYSYRKASIGSNWAAFLAGYQPKNIPVMVQTAKDRITLQAWMYIGK